MRPMISDVADMFGCDVMLSDETKMHVNDRAMWRFAKNFAPGVLILEPKRYVVQVRRGSRTHHRCV